MLFRLRKIGYASHVLERIALHQTRLRTPGLSLDARGIAVGAKGLVLFPTVDRLVAWLAVYTQDRSLEDILPSLRIQLVRSKLGTQELILGFAAESTDRMDHVAETARLVGGFTFTGYARNFVQYRDAAAPFGYDVTELVESNLPIALYHEKFTQAYEEGRVLELKKLLQNLMPHPAPETIRTLRPATALWVVAESGLGPALIQYLVRSQVAAEVAVAEWPPETAFDDGPTRRYVFRIPDLPVRMRALVLETPGLTAFLPNGPSVAVELGFRHPVTLRSCPVFSGLCLIRKGGVAPLQLDPLPQFGDVRAFARVEVNLEGEALVAQRSHAPNAVRLQLRLTPIAAEIGRGIAAVFFPTSELDLFRALAYVLPHETIQRLEVAVTSGGIVLRGNVEGVPLGTHFKEIYPNLYLAAGYDFVPKVSPQVLHEALHLPESSVLFISYDGRTERALAVDRNGFVPLETLLLEAPPWQNATHEAIERALLESVIELQVEPLGLLPMRDV